MNLVGIYGALFVFVVGSLTWVDRFDPLSLVIAGPLLYHLVKLRRYVADRETLEPGPASGRRLSLALSAPLMVVLPVAFAVLALVGGRGLFRGIGGMLYLVVPVLSWILGLLLGALGLLLGGVAVSGLPQEPPAPRPPGP